MKPLREMTDEEFDSDPVNTLQCGLETSAFLSATDRQLRCESIVHFTAELVKLSLENF